MLFLRHFFSQFCEYLLFQTRHLHLRHPKKLPRLRLRQILKIPKANQLSFHHRQTQQHFLQCDSIHTIFYTGSRIGQAVLHCQLLSGAAGRTYRRIEGHGSLTRGQGCGHFGGGETRVPSQLDKGWRASKLKFQFLPSFL